MHWKELVARFRPTQDRYGSFFAVIIAVIAVRSIIEVYLHGEDPLSYVFILLTGILTASYGLFRFLEVFQSPGLGVRYLV
ncbi:MAG TPA: hypothetical protein VLH13_02110, partial [Methanomassiliicoccales archaeon]|nr:hypothetical protein [Methanomassiliicoccales archaeon]